MTKTIETREARELALEMAVRVALFEGAGLERTIRIAERFRAFLEADAPGLAVVRPIRPEVDGDAARP